MIFFKHRLFQKIARLATVCTCTVFQVASLSLPDWYNLPSHQILCIPPSMKRAARNRSWNVGQKQADNPELNHHSVINNICELERLVLELASICSRTRIWRAYLHAFPFFADKRRLHHTVITPQLPDFVYQLDIVPTRRCNTVSSQRVLFRRLWGSLGMKDVKNNVAFAHIKIPRDHWWSIHNLNENLRQERSCIRQQHCAQ